MKATIRFAPLLIGLVWAPAARADEARAPSVLFSEGFDDARLVERGWYDGDRFAISAKGARAGSGCIEYHWKAGGSTPDSSSGLRRLFEPSETVFLRCYVRLSKGWGWTGRAYHPHLMHFLTTENGKYHGPAGSHLTVYIEPQEGKLRLAAQDIQNKDAPHGLTQGPLRGGYNAKVYDSRDVLFRDDQWHCVEAMFQLNSLDLMADKPNADGIVRGWFDGELVVDRTDVILRSTDFPKMKFNQFLLTPYFGPGLLPHEQTLWIDELAVGTARLGLLKSTAASEARPKRSLTRSARVSDPAETRDRRSPASVADIDERETFGQGGGGVGRPAEPRLRPSAWPPRSPAIAGSTGESTTRRKCSNALTSP